MNANLRLARSLLISLGKLKFQLPLGHGENCKRKSEWRALLVEVMEERRLLASDGFNFESVAANPDEYEAATVLSASQVDIFGNEELGRWGGDRLRHHFAGLPSPKATVADVPWEPSLANAHLQQLKNQVAGQENYLIDAEGNVLAINPLRDGDSLSKDLNSVFRRTDPSHTPPFPLDQTFVLNSRPNATKTIYLDFNGHNTVGTSWNNLSGVSPIVTPAYTLDSNPDFSSAELEQIQRIWERVAEDFIPFEVNVTTQEPPINDLRNSGGSDTRWGIRVVIGANTGWYSNVGGVAYLNSFNWSTDTPTFVFNSSEKSVAEAISHEVGHTLGLSHDGTSSVAYYRGHGSGATGWAPIMGVGYDRELVQWSRGEYPGANNTQNDLQIITTNNGFGYRTDDHSNGIVGATQLVVAGASVYGDGIIERVSDTDFFKFTTTGGNTQLTINPFYRSPNLDILATLFNAAGTVVATSNPVSSLSASFALSLAAGTYFLSVDGTGKAASGSDFGYSDYASLGYYSISGNVPNAIATISQSFVYHKGSSFASTSVENALDSSKNLASEGSSPLTLDFSNLINSSRGINGLVFDIQDLPSTTLSTSDFQFQVSPTGAFVEAENPPISWQTAPSPSSISVTPGSPSRLVMEWPDFAIANRWLRITINANTNTGLASPEVFYIGHLLGETTGSAEGVYTVSFADITPIRNAVGQTVGAGDIHDIDKNATVSFLDISTMREYVGAQLRNITIPASGAGGSGGELLSSPSNDAAPNSSRSPSVSRSEELSAADLTVAAAISRFQLIWPFPSSHTDVQFSSLLRSYSDSGPLSMERKQSTVRLPLIVLESLPTSVSSSRSIEGQTASQLTAHSRSSLRRIDDFFEELAVGSRTSRE